MNERKDLTCLAETAEDMLGGLHAGERLRQRILNEAQGGRARPTWQAGVRRYAPVAAALVLVVGVGALSIRQFIAAPEFTAAPAPIEVNAAGSPTGMPGAVNLAFDSVPNDSIEVHGLDNLAGEEDFSEQDDDDGFVESDDYVPQDEYVEEAQWQEPPVEAAMDLPSFHSLFVSGDGGNFPLVGLNGYAYRQTYVSVSDGSLEGSLGTVALYTDEPALADWSQILSNVADAGSEIYQISGISSNTAVAAYADGALSLFQRASFSGHGTSGQSLEDTLGIRSNVSSMTLSGVGKVSDSAKANALASLLLDSASFYNDDMQRGRQSLDIVLKNGLTLQLMVSDGLLSACGTWSCAEFFESFPTMID